MMRYLFAILLTMSFAGCFFKAGITPNVLIIGDSISMGYMSPLVGLLEGEANVVHNPGNAQHTEYGLVNLDDWLGDTDWAVIHFNHGLHDLKYVDADGKNVRTKDAGDIQIPLEEYERNLDAIARRLKQTGAHLIFATTTPYPDRPDGPLREAHQASRYNEAALRVMARHEIAVNDLHGFVLPQMEALQRPNNVHFTEAGSAALAEEVARYIQDALQRN